MCVKPKTIVSISPEIVAALEENAVVAIAVSGGKDSSIAAIKTVEFLRSCKFAGEIILIHSDLGSVEWTDSIAVCERLSERLNLPLVIVSRKAGGMMQRWQTRWNNNVQRYQELSCVKMILPWSTPSMRFCTSELKTAIICRELTQKFPGKTIINVTGVRRDESDNRANTPISKANKLLTRADGTNGYDWQPIVEMLTEDIFLAHKQYDFPLHEAYTVFGSSRVSCAFCIMSKRADLAAAASCPDNHAIYREMCELEIESCFSFQSNTWLSDVRPDLLTHDQRARLANAKFVQMRRAALESQIPKHLLYTKNFPECIPTYDEAILLCEIRKSVAALQNIEIGFTEPENLIARYEQLMVEKLALQARKAAKAERLACKQNKGRKLNAKNTGRNKKVYV